MNKSTSQFKESIDNLECKTFQNGNQGSEGSGNQVQCGVVETAGDVLWKSEGREGMEGCHSEDGPSLLFEAPGVE